MIGTKIKIVGTENISSRLEYTLDFIFGSVLGLGYEYVTIDLYTNDPNDSVIYYLNDITKTGLARIHPIGLLSQNMESLIDVSKDTEILAKEIKHLLDSGTPNNADIFSFIFYMITRYEEYFTFEKDHLGRYQSKSSIAHRHDFIRRPIVDECIQWLALRIENAGIPVHPVSSYALQSTIDIDQVWAFAHKGVRNLWGMIKDVVTLDFTTFNRRRLAWNNEQLDPFNTYDTIDGLHDSNNLKPKFFFLLSSIRTKYDTNHDPEIPAFQKLIKYLSNKYEVNIHPSYQSNSATRNIMLKEKNCLEKILSRPVTESRQHFLMLTLPTTYRKLLEIGITKDYSMGYADTVGYRAGTGHEFYWYDLEKEMTSNLKIHPFQIMDVTLKNYMMLNPDVAISECTKIIDYAQKVNSPICILWHNSSLDEAGDWNGWTEVYRQLLAL